MGWSLIGSFLKFHLVTKDLYEIQIKGYWYLILEEFKMKNIDGLLQKHAFSNAFKNNSVTFSDSNIHCT